MCECVTAFLRNDTLTVSPRDPMPNVTSHCFPIYFEMDLGGRGREGVRWNEAPDETNDGQELCK